jgi:hypothetical protein
MASIGFSKLSQWVSEYGDCFAIRNSESSKYILTFAIQLFTAQEKNYLSQHVQTTVHLTSLNPESTDNFCNDLCEAFVAANIPLSKLQNPVLKRFLQKYTNRPVPDESTLRKNYVGTELL